MAGSRRTRQSNRAYQERLRQGNQGNSRTQGNRARQQSSDRVQAGGAGRTDNPPKLRVLPGDMAQHSGRTGQPRKAARQTAATDSKRAKTRTNRHKPSQTATKTAAASRQLATGNERKVAAREHEVRRRKSEERVQEARTRTKGQQVFFDYTLVFIIFFLIMFGLLMLYTASIYTNAFFIKQCVISLLGIVIMFVFSKIDYHLYEKKPIIFLIAAGSVLAVFLVITPLGVELNGARRWIGVGDLTVQPAEIFKIGVILTNAVLLTKWSRHIAKWQTLMTFALLTILEMLYILKLTDNLSSALIVGAITVLMVFVAHPGYKLFLAGGIGIFAVAFAYVEYILHYVDTSKNFRYDRILAWLAPERLADPSKAYQTTQALYSIGSGGPWGKGLGAGTQKMILPEAMNDMVFAIICEELGMIGAFLVLVMFAILLYRLMFIAKNSKDLFGGMIATGIFAHFMLQVSLNIGVVTNLLPSTGVTLPFISYGGTASVLLLAEIGIALNVSRQIDFEQPKLVRRRKRSQ